MTGRAVLRDAIRSRRRNLAAGALLLILHQTCEALVPVMVGVVIDEAVTTGDEGALLWSIAALVVLFAVLSTAFRLGFRQVQRAAERAEHDLRMAVSRRLLDPAGTAGGGRQSGELVSVATSDAGRVAAIARVVAFGCGVTAAVTVASVVLLSVSVTLGLLVLLGLPPALVAVQLATRPLIRRAGTEQGQAATTAALATDLVSGLRVLKGIGAERAAVDRYRSASRGALDATLRAARADAALNGITTLVVGGFLVLVAAVGGHLALDGELGVGELVAAVGLTQFLVEPLSTVPWIASELARARASATPFAAVLETPPAVASGAGEPEPGELRFGDVTIAPGRLTGIATADADLVDGLAREREVGGITLAGTPLAELDLVALRRTVLVSPHDAELFEGTVADNLGGADAAVRAAAAVEDIDPDAAVGERGTALSGGQRQRVALARALAAGAPVLVLHEPTTAVDAATEARIAAGLRDVRAGRTTVLVTTSPALLAAADEVIVPGGPRGTHAELMRDAAYRELVLA